MPKWRRTVRNGKRIDLLTKKILEENELTFFGNVLPQVAEVIA